MSVDAQQEVAAPLEAEGAEAASPELHISQLLRIGVATSLSLVVLGTLVMFSLHPEWLWSKEALWPLTHEPGAPHNLAEVAQGLGGRPGRSLIMVGLLLLMGLPVARVALSLVLFAQKRDRAYTAITATVLTLLVLSYALGWATH